MPFRVMLCLLIVSVHTHCVLAHGAELLRQVEAAQRGQRAHRKYATLWERVKLYLQGCHADRKAGRHAHSTRAGGFGKRTLTLRYLRVAAPNTKRDLDCCLEPPSPPGGTDARALLQSFQI